MNMKLETKILDSQYSNYLKCAYRLGYVRDDQNIRLEDLDSVNKDIFPKAYIPKKIENVGETLYQTYDVIRDTKNAYDVRYLWFSMNGELYEDSLYRYFTYNNKNPMYMVRVMIDQHYSSIRDIDYCVNTQSIVTRTDYINEISRVTIFESEILDPVIEDKIIAIINNLKFESF